MIISEYVGKRKMDLDERILSLVKKNPNISIGVLMNRMRSVKRDLMASELQSMVDAGTLTAEEIKVGRGGQKSLKFSIPEK